MKTVNLTQLRGKAKRDKNFSVISAWQKNCKGVKALRCNNCLISWKAFCDVFLEILKNIFSSVQEVQSLNILGKIDCNSKYINIGKICFNCLEYGGYMDGVKSSIKFTNFAKWCVAGGGGGSEGGAKLSITRDFGGFCSLGVAPAGISPSWFTAAELFLRKSEPRPLQQSFFLFFFQISRNSFLSDITWVVQHEEMCGIAGTFE